MNNSKYKKGKVVRVHAMKAYMACRGIAPVILTSASDGGEW
jgi:hypothetical protein